MTDFTRLRQAAAAARLSRANLDRQIGELNAEARAVRVRLAEANATGNAAVSEAARARIGELTAARKGVMDARSRLRDEVAGALEGLLGREFALEADAPLVLLPVRIEVRSTADGSALRVRIFPDSIHVESLDEGIDARELEAGIAYWNEVWVSGETQAPWPHLVSIVGARRAPWVAHALRPSNLAARPDADPVFPNPPPRVGSNTLARTLPDRFHVRVEQDGAPPVTVQGAPLPDEVPVGLQDEASLAALDLAGFDLPVIDESLKWLIDYAEAERQGMAVTVQLPIAGRKVRKLVVYGVRASLQPAEGAKRLERLIRSHRFTDGAEFVAQGTPTNNTDTARTGWSRRAPSGPPHLAEDAPAPDGSNASVVASALDIDPALLMSLPGARDIEQARASAFNTALWTTTWKEAVEHISQAGRNNGDKQLDSPSLDAVRDHWVDHVRGRGPLPAIRFGRQPYGLLPLTATDASWQPLLGGFVEERLVPFIHQSVRPYWNSAQSAVATIANRPLDTALPEILGTDAVLRSLRVRSAVAPDMTFETAAAWVLPDLGQQRSTQHQVAQSVNLVSGVEWGEVGDNDLLGKKTRTLALPLVHETDGQYIANLIASAPQTQGPASVLQVLLEHAVEVERHNRDKMMSPAHRGLVREAIDAMPVETDRGMLARAFEAVQAQAFNDRRVEAAAAAIAKRVGRFDARVVADRHPIPALAPATTLQQVAGVEPTATRLAGSLGMQFIGEIFHAAGWSGRFRAALETIAAIDNLEERRLLLCETLDCCSHRLDAWITSAATRRLRGVRRRGASGAYVGAYGWLENIQLQTPTPAGQIDGKDVLHDGADGGFIHAPGLNQAATAGVLRSGRLTHRRGDPNNEALDIDLSSARVRDALSLLEGMRRGQSLGALLGYRIERRLHERSGNGLELDRFIYVLRALAPLRAGKLTAPDQTAEESLAARNVVDGLKLMELQWPVILAKLVAGPDDSRYIGRWLAPRPADPARDLPGEADAVKAAIAELQQTHDAVADLLLAESVHQMVAGNPARAAAAMDVLGAGEAIPPGPEVVRTPRTGITISHRIAILIADPPPVVPGWNADAPRARAEPRLEAWAQSVLDDPSTIRIVVDRLETLADAGLAALDVMYDADGDSVSTSTLAARLRLEFGPLEKELPLLAPLWELAGMLRERLVAGRALEVADLGYPKSEDATRRVPDADEILARAKLATQELRTAAAAGVIAGLLPYGIRPSAPSPTLDLTSEEESVATTAMAQEALRRVSAAELLLARAAPPLPLPQSQPPSVKAELARSALAEVFGAEFIALPLLGEAPDIASDPWTKAVSAAGVTARPGADIRPWLARAGVMRSGVSKYGETLLVREALGRATRLRVIQTPVEAYGTWAGLPFPDAVPPKEPLRSTVAEVVGGPEVDLSKRIAGVVIDEWMEVVPQRLEVGDPAQETKLVDVTTTGIALNANAPGSRPPQAILIALTPDGASWNGERLVQILDEALALARIRCVTLDQLPIIGRYLPALYFSDWSLQGEPVIDWMKVATEFDGNLVEKFLKVEQ